MSDFTPGPWRICQHPNTLRYTNIMALREGGGFVVAQTGYMPDLSLETCEANAVLIAAAPALYEALTEMLHGDPFKAETREKAAKVLFQINI